jgi:Saccharopine dehydrogenase NADP binding domain
LAYFLNRKGIKAGMARILILGGAGVQGQQAARTAKLHNRGEDHIIVLSRDPARGSEAAGRLDAFSGSGTVSSAVADLTDPSSFAALVQQGDIVLNAAAPFFELGATAAKISVDAGAHYFDICDDWEATVPILELHNKAMAKQVIVVTGFGAAPGITSMLATIAMRELDDVEQIVTAWPVSGGGTPTVTSHVPYVHFVQCCVGPIRQVRDGRFNDETPLMQEYIALPGGKQLVGYTIGSPESVTLPIGNNGIRSSIALAMMNETTADNLRTLAGAVREGAFSLVDAANLLRQNSAGGDDPLPDDVPPDICAIAIGMKNGARTSVYTRLLRWPDYDYNIAGTALGLVPKLMRERAFEYSGAYSIEAVLSPEVYFDALAEAISAGFQYQIETISGPI